MIKYLLDLIFIFDDFVCIVFFLMVFVVVCLVRKILVFDKFSWILGLFYFFCYVEKDFILCMKKMVDFLIKVLDCKF